MINSVNLFNLAVNLSDMKTYYLLSCILIFLLFPSCANDDYIVWVAGPWQQVIQSTPPGEQKEAVLKSASNEYEPFRLIIHNLSDEGQLELSVTAEDLKSSNGNKISSDNINLFRAHYLHITKSSRRLQKPEGWYPDALIPFSDGNLQAKSEYVAAPFSVDTGMNAEVWCDLYVPPGTEPGTYKGNVNVMSGKKRVARVPVTLTVWDFELPTEISMRSHFGKFNEASAKIAGTEKGSGEFPEMEKLYNKALLEHRAVPSTPDNVWPEWNETDGIIESGESARLRELIEKDKVNAIDIPFRYYREDPQKCKDYLQAMAKWLRDLGYLDLAYIYLEDEPNSAEEYEIVRKQGELIRSADPGIKRMCTEQTKPSKPEWGNLYGAVDIWCPLWGLFDEPTAAERLVNGEELWSYTALCQGPDGTPWWQIDADPLNFRSPFWISWIYNINGFLYWSSTYWRAYETAEGVWEAPWFRKDFWGEGMLLYPGKPAGVNGFVPSIRLKLYREAMEDYEYMVMASKNGSKEEVNQIVSSVANSFQSWSNDSRDYEAARGRLANLIVN